MKQRILRFWPQNAKSFKIGHQCYQFALDLFFPIECICCHKAGELICGQCKKNIPRLTFQKCPACERAITMHGELCQLCAAREKNGVDQLIIAADYNNPLLSRAIHLYKYNFLSSLQAPLGELLAQSLQSNLTFTPDLILAVPLHPRRLRWRGYNQSNLLAQYLSHSLIPGLEIPFPKNLLTRTRFTPPQAKIKGLSQRQANIQGAFSLNQKTSPENNIRGKRILLIDDVCTTGSTIQECAKTLRAHHPKHICAAVLARQM